MSDRSLLLIKAEVTYGLDPVAAAANAVWAENVKFTPKGDRVVGLVAKPGQSPIPGHIVGEHGELTFDVPMASSGVAGTAPKWGYLLPSCGFAETLVANTSVTYSLAADPSQAPSVVIVWRDGRRTHKLLGARGRVGFKGMALQRPMLSFTFKGLHQDVAEGAVLAHADANFTGWRDARPIVQGRSNFAISPTLGTFVLREFSFDQSDNVLFRDLPHQENVTLRGERTWTGKLKIGTPLPSVMNPEAIWKAGMLYAYQLSNEYQVVGEMINVLLRAQLGQPSYEDDQGEDVMSCDLYGQSSSISNDNDVVITLT